MLHSEITENKISENLRNPCYPRSIQLKRQVKRNIERFPEDFMFELTKGV